MCTERIPTASGVTLPAYGKRAEVANLRKHEPERQGGCPAFRADRVAASAHTRRRSRAITLDSFAQMSQDDGQLSCSASRSADAV